MARSLIRDETSASIGRDLELYSDNMLECLRS